jgi:hypothetical protein
VAVLVVLAQETARVAALAVGHLVAAMVAHAQAVRL